MLLAYNNLSKMDYLFRYFLNPKNNPLNINTKIPPSIGTGNPGGGVGGGGGVCKIACLTIKIVTTAIAITNTSPIILFCLLI